MSYAFSAPMHRVGMSPAGKRIAADGEAFARRMVVTAATVPLPPPAPQPVERPKLRTPPLPQVTEALPTISPRITVAAVVEATASHYGRRVSEMLEPRRTKDIAAQRQVAMYLAKEMTPTSLQEIGRRMGGRDHTTILHGWRAVRGRVEAGNPVVADIEDIRTKLLRDLQSMREKLADRRLGVSFTFLAGERGQERELHATVGHYPDGRVGEVFITGTKVANSAQIIANEAAVAISFALQHGASLEAMREAMPREEDGRPQGVMGALLDAILKLPKPGGGA